MSMSRLWEILKWWIQQSEVQEIKTIYASLNPEEKEQAKKKIKDQIDSEKNTLSIEAKESLATLIWDINTNKEINQPNGIENQIENIASISMEDVKAWNTSEVFKKVFDANIFDIYLWMWDRLTEYKWDAFKNISVVLWNRLLNKASSQWLLSILWEKMQKLLSFMDESKDKGDIITNIKDEFFTENVDTKTENKWTDEQELMKVIDNILKDEFVMLKKLSESSKTFSTNEEKKQFKDLTKNPIIMEKVISTWVYEDNSTWLKINLNSWVFDLKIWTSLLANDDAKQKFLKETIDITNSIWEKADWLKNWFWWFMWIAEKLWFTMDDVKWIVDDLSEIPIIGIFFKMLFKFFTWDLWIEQVQNQVDQTKIEDPKKVSIKNFLSFQSKEDNKKYFPDNFSLTNENDFSDFNWFYDRIDQSIKEDKNLTEEQKKNTTNDIVKSTDFWEKIYTWKSIVVWSIEEEIYKKLKEINEHNPKYDKKDYLEKINNIDLSNYKKENTNTNESKQLTTGEMNTSTNVDVNQDVVKNKQKIPSPEWPITDIPIVQTTAEVDPEQSKKIEVTQQTKPELQNKPAEIVEKPKTILEQIESWKTNDFELDWKKVHLEFDSSEKKIKLNDKWYDITFFTTVLTRPHTNVTPTTTINKLSLNELTVTYTDREKWEVTNLYRVTKDFFLTKNQEEKSKLNHWKAEIITGLLKKWQVTLSGMWENKDIDIEITEA